MVRPKPAMLVWLAAVGAALSVGAAAIPLPARFARQSGLPLFEARQPVPVKRTSIEPIFAMAPFGRAVGTGTTSGDVTETTLGLTLYGVVIATQGKASSAIISGGLEPAQIYFVGDVVTDAASLDAVFSDHVVLSIEGRRETLSFPAAHSRRNGPDKPLAVGFDLAAEPAAVAADPDVAEGGEESLAAEGLSALRAFIASARGEDPSDPENVVAIEPEVAVGEVDAEGSPAVAAPAPEALPEDPADLAQSLRRRFSENPTALLEEYGLSATPAGYRVGAEGATSLARVGLEADDLISKVNGRDVGDVAADGAIVDEAFAAGHVRLELERRGQPVRLSFPLW